MVDRFVVFVTGGRFSGYRFNRFVVFMTDGRFIVVGLRLNVSTLRTLDWFSIFSMGSHLFLQEQFDNTILQ